MGRLIELKLLDCLTICLSVHFSQEGAVCNKMFQSQFSVIHHPNHRLNHYTSFNQSSCLHGQCNSIYFTPALHLQGKAKSYVETDGVLRSAAHASFVILCYTCVIFVVLYSNIPIIFMWLCPLKHV